MKEPNLFDDSKYVSANDAALSSGFTRDYISRLCREGKIQGRRVGRNWYVENASLQEFLVIQEYHKSLRSASLSEKRANEYKKSAGSGLLSSTNTPVSGHSVPSFKGFQRSATQIQAPEPLGVLKQRSEAIRDRLIDALDRNTSGAVQSASNLAHAPSGFASAALQAAHVPVYTVTPIMEFAHKLVALMFTIVIIFGLCAVANPQSATFALGVMRDEASSAFSVSKDGIALAVEVVSPENQSRAANIAENPQVAAAGLSTELNIGVNSVLSGAIALSQLRLPSVAGTPHASVRVEIRPYRTPEAATSSLGTMDASSSTR